MVVKNFKSLLVLVTLLAVGGTVAAQSGDISPERKQAIDSLALEKVRDLSKYISIIGNKKTAYSEATRVMDRAEELFSPGAEMGVSSITCKEPASPSSLFPLSPKEVL